MGGAQSSQLPIGPTMSPRIFPVSAIHPNCLPDAFPGDGGITSATGSPNLVTRIGLRVLRTCSRIPRHLALNSEMATSFIESDCTMVNDHGQSWFFIEHGFLPGRSVYTPITATSSFTASALLFRAAFSSDVSLISMICSMPFAPSFTGTPT